jgi:hypothetical protein
LKKESFELLLKALAPLIIEIKEYYSAVEVYSSDYKLKPTKTEYWNSVNALLDNGESNLIKRLGRDCKNPDRHKSSGLLLVSLLKKPLFIVNYGKTDSSVGYYSASLIFAWKAALSLLKDYVLNDSNILPEYADYLKNNGISMPSDKYEKETLRTIELCFRSFHFEDSWHSIPAPFNELDSEALASDKDWGWALIFANIFFLIESNSFANFRNRDNQ